MIKEVRKLNIENQKEQILEIAENIHLQAEKIEGISTLIKESIGETNEVNSIYIALNVVSDFAINIKNSADSLFSIAGD